VDGNHPKNRNMVFVFLAKNSIKGFRGWGSVYEAIKD